ncbi:hypothetical protein WISP_147220 [Willisornis vidua]|uniref:Uncharacterized protein n=1 Tax=Willisornis vidua TaxID=1566151 RepID=A0ABQ9CKN5_9PASS|nr:hypothetical protein WISP_147220 [Willisornis vidua]
MAIECQGFFSIPLLIPIDPGAETVPPILLQYNNSQHIRSDVSEESGSLSFSRDSFAVLSGDIIYSTRLPQDLFHGALLCNCTKTVAERENKSFGLEINIHPEVRFSNIIPVSGFQEGKINVLSLLHWEGDVRFWN